MATQLPAFSSADDVPLAFLAVLEDAQENRGIMGSQRLFFVERVRIRQQCTHFWIFARLMQD